MIDNLRGVSQQVCYDVKIMVISFRLMKRTRIHKKYSYSMIPSVKKRGNYWLITLSEADINTALLLLVSELS